MGIQAYVLAFQNLKFSADMALLVIAMVVPLAVSLIHVLRVYTKTRFE